MSYILYVIKNSISSRSEASCFHLKFTNCSFGTLWFSKSDYKVGEWLEDGLCSWLEAAFTRDESSTSFPPSNSWDDLCGNRYVFLRVAEFWCRLVPLSFGITIAFCGSQKFKVDWELLFSKRLWYLVEILLQEESLLAIVLSSGFSWASELGWPSLAPSYRRIVVAMFFSPNLIFRTCIVLDTHWWSFACSFPHLNSKCHAAWQTHPKCTLKMSSPEKKTNF